MVTLTTMLFAIFLKQFQLFMFLHLPPTAYIIF